MIFCCGKLREKIQLELCYGSCIGIRTLLYWIQFSSHTHQESFVFIIFCPSFFSHPSSSPFYLLSLKAAFLALLLCMLNSQMFVCAGIIFKSRCHYDFTFCTDSQCVCFYFFLIKGQTLSAFLIFSLSPYLRLPWWTQINSA